MSVEEIKALERRWFDELNKGKAAAMAVIDELCATNFVWHPSTGERARAKTEIIKLLRWSTTTTKKRGENWERCLCCTPPKRT